MEEKEIVPFIPNIRERSIGMALALYENRQKGPEELIEAAEQIRTYIESGKANGQT